uniref:Uncharacterized protein n=1 Tax=Octactis speculum TaxID=3111310 RepID=A0A7S2GP24_9STRA|mmetsp:Transcript_53525/g.73120  ORF Transcript_53525/g.73120 Transcript_53525/m.73120 type:complete len:414 (+) Transcript_53525:146-1387(+)
MLPTTKAGPGDKEPAYIILKKHLLKVLGILALVGLFVVFRLQGNSMKIEKLESRVHGFSRNLKFWDMKEKSAHASVIAKLGEEVEQHLDRDIVESELATEIMRTMTSLKAEYLANVTTMVKDATSLSVEAQSEETAIAMREARDMMQARADEGINFLFTCFNAKVGPLVKRLAREAKHAEARRTEIQAEIVKQLKKSHEFEEKSHEPHAPGDLDGDGWTEDMDGDGYADHPPPDIDDDESRLMTDKWHNDTVYTFFDHLERYMVEKNDPNSTAVPPMDVGSHLYEELSNAYDHLKNEQVSWSDIQDLLKARKDSLAEARLPPFEDAEPVSDDEHTYAQSWHVQSYLDEVLWPAKLNAHIPNLMTMRNKVKSGDMTPLEASGTLEEMAVDEIFPHHWLHHMSGGDDYYYRDYHY